MTTTVDPISGAGIWCQKWGHKIRLFSHGFLVHGLRKIGPVGEVMGAWQWHDHLHSLVAPEVEIVDINLDETSVRLFHGNRRGNIAFAHQMPTHEQPRQSASTKDTRGALTHVALMCNNDTVQQELPQVLICNDHLVTLAQTARIRAALPHNVYFLRRKSSWVNKKVMLEIFALLTEVLRQFQGMQFVLAMDTAKAHLHGEIREYLHGQNFLVYYIPASCTWLLQMADTHLFALYKNKLKELFHDYKADTNSRKVPIEAIVGMVSSVIETVLNGRSWSHAWLRNGFCRDRTQVSARIPFFCAWPQLPAVPAGAPSQGQLKKLFPRNYAVGANMPNILPAALALPAPPPALMPLPPLPPPMSPRESLPDSQASTRRRRINRIYFSSLRSSAQASQVDETSGALEIPADVIHQPWMPGRSASSSAPAGA